VDYTGSTRHRLLHHHQEKVQEEVEKSEEANKNEKVRQV